jgi:ABC-type sugar transport system permease subunit
MGSDTKTVVEQSEIERAEQGFLVSRLSLKQQEFFEGWLFISGKLLLILGVIGFPVMFGFYVSFTESNLFNLPGEFVGLDNYRWLLTYDVWWRSILNVSIIGIVLIPTNIIFSFTTALLLHEKFRGNYLYRVMFLIPVAGPPLIWAIIWKFLLFPTDGGFINATILTLNIVEEPIKFLSRSHLALPSVILSQMWGFGLAMLIYLAALSGVPTSVMESAQMDGAGRYARVRYIIWPLMKPTTLFLVVIQLIMVFRLGFSAVFVLTGGGPFNSTMVPSYFIYKLAFVNSAFGKSAAAAAVMFGMTALITLIVYKALQSQVEYYQ